MPICQTFKRKSAVFYSVIFDNLIEQIKKIYINKRMVKLLPKNLLLKMSTQVDVKLMTSFIKWFFYP